MTIHEIPFLVNRVNLDDVVYHAAFLLSGTTELSEKPVQNREVLVLPIFEDAVLGKKRLVSSFRDDES